MSNNIYILIIAAGLMFVVIGGLSILSHYYTLNGIKSRTVGDGQHGTARFATKREIQKTYSRVLFTPQEWREGMNCPDLQGVVLGCVGHKNKLKALVDTGDVHTLMIGASGVGKTAFFLYPNLEFACASGMSFLVTDTKGDVFRNYGVIAK
ncbi:MAG: type IV secretory system conjugative DNA transfer family protein, partial [Oscillospiraceae bacterium]